MYSSRPHAPIVGPGPTGQRADGRCALEIHFPRLARELTQQWFRAGIDDLLDHLILDDRNGRAGFPLEVIDELLFLAGVRWWLTHTGRVPDLATDREYLDYLPVPAEEMLIWSTRAESLGRKAAARGYRPGR